MNKSLFVLLIALTCIFPSSKKGKFKVIGERSNNIGKFIYEKDSSKVFAFQFVNVGDSLLTISDVIPSCTCMDVSWSCEPLAPSDTGSIHVVYHVQHPGHFKNMLTVLGDGFPEWDYIYIEGTAMIEPSNDF